ncbi:asparagine synthase (glutamine-hydrolyzing) [Aquimarina megaterium]|uniref:asparagine synthase (glutamine-hydrolyzing) n=1 Tax=Aquimarina megaterium TaxID=1443666 RepID=UPI000472085B|nr:asparagine synthase (glutamine-hydrolyzing) [Aquimarina megaterium]
MCGIIGYFGDRYEQFSNEKLLELLTHRGPDNIDDVLGDKFYLGQTRLSIVDLSEKGNQPMISQDKRYVIVFNGEIYNHKELRKNELSNVEFRSQSDTETLLYGLIKEGSAFLNKLNGIFSFSFLDIQTGDFLLARDQFGVKPLYYFLSKEELYFSSEIKAIKPFMKKKDIDLGALKNYINFLWAPGELTPFKSIRKLLPGQLIQGNISSISNVEKRKYYSIPFNNKTFSNLTEERLIDLLDEKLNKALSRQMMSDVPLGFFLSGGLDSSLLVAIARKQFPNKKIICYTIKSNLSKAEGFEEDLFYAKQVAEFLNVTLRVVDAGVDVLQYFDKVIYHLDEPQADPAPINVYNICKLAREDGIKVLIGGTAGDDVFSGYRRHQALRIEPIIRFFPKIFRKTLKIALSRLKKRNANFRRLSKLTKDIHLSKINRMIGYFDWSDKKLVEELFLVPNEYDLKQYFYQLIEQIKNQPSDLNKMLYWELNTFLPDHNLNYTDKLSMATGVEVRVPFLDKELVEFSTKIPPQFKLKGTETKYILKKVAEKYLPNEVIYRSKTGFGAPVREWILNDMNSIIEEYLGENTIKKRGIFNYTKVQKLIKMNKEGIIDASYTIWALLAIESWMRQFYD